MSDDNIIKLHPGAENITLNVEQIQKLIPHRAPILLLEKLTNIVTDESATGIKCVSVNEPFFEGHFPRFKVMPGVLIVEAMAQTAAALVIYSIERSQEDLLVYFMSIESARFRKPVVPGDVLELHVKKEQQRGNVWRFTGKAIVNGAVHADATFTAMIVEKKD